MLLPVCGYVFDGVRCRRRGPHRCHGRARHVVAFFTELLHHTKGDYAGKPFIPSAWQRDRVLAPLIGEVVFDPKRDRYVRRYRILYLCVARKNGKTELLAGLVLYLLCGDGEMGAEVYGLALDMEQAGLVYGVARRMVRLSPALSDRLDVIPSTARIVDETTGSFYSVVASDALGNLGSNPSGAYIDELLTQPDRDLYDAIRTGFGARAEPLLMLATTAENDPSGFPATEREWSERVLEDPGLEPERLVVIYSADRDLDWRQPATWRKANPALGDFLEFRTLHAECHAAQGNPAAERSFRQYRLNQPIGRVGAAIDLNVWDANGAELPDLAGATCYGGLDLASRSDLAAYALDFPDGDGGHQVLWRHFCPAGQLRELSRRTGGHADLWVGRGLLTVTEGDAIDYGAIVHALAADRDRYDIREIAYDRWGATQLATELTEDGWPLIQFGQGFASMSGPTRELLRCLALGSYHHGGSPIMRWQASNVIARTDPAGNLKFDKQHSPEKIDGLVAAVMALDRACRHQASNPDYAVAGFR